MNRINPNSRAIVLAVTLASLIVLAGCTIAAPGAPQPQSVSVETVAEDPAAFLGTEITIEGWYQGGSVRNADPVCANTREGIAVNSYDLVYTDIPANTTLYTGVKYRFTGSVRPSEAVNRTVPGQQPVFVPRTIERIEEGADGCSLTA